MTFVLLYPLIIALFIARILCGVSWNINLNSLDAEVKELTLKHTSPLKKLPSAFFPNFCNVGCYIARMFKSLKQEDTFYEFKFMYISQTPKQYFYATTYVLWVGTPICFERWKEIGYMYKNLHISMFK